MQALRSRSAWVEKAMIERYQLLWLYEITHHFIDTKDEPMFKEEIHDIEDLGRVARERFGACPYYLSRELQQDVSSLRWLHSAKTDLIVTSLLFVQAEMIFMPYNYLIDPSTRRSLSVDLEGTVLIFDEAHNLVCCLPLFYIVL